MDTLRTRFSISRHVRGVTVDGQAVLMDLKKGVYLGLDEVGTRIWELIPESPAGEVLVERLRAEYDVSEQSLHDDVRSFLEELQARGLIVASGANP